MNQSQGEIEFVYAAPDSHSLRTTGTFASLAIIVLGMLTALRRLKTTACKSPGSRFKGK